MTAKMGKYSGDQLSHAISRDNDPSTVRFMYFPCHKLEATHDFNKPPCIISEELLINTSYFITRLGIEQASMGIWDKDNHNFTKPNELHNEKTTEGVFEGTGITSI